MPRHCLPEEAFWLDRGVAPARSSSNPETRPDHIRGHKDSARTGSVVIWDCVLAACFTEQYNKLLRLLSW